MADLKDSRAQSRLEKAARERGNAWVNYEVEAKSAAVCEGPALKK
jgi:hypothetical protein